jgi:hypothetical protein
MADDGLRRLLRVTVDDREQAESRNQHEETLGRLEHRHRSDAPHTLPDAHGQLP